MQDGKRDKAIDIAKGILILLVVVGHAESVATRYIYWFHMPAFFMVSGLFFKPVNNLSEFKQLAGKLVTSLLVPYFSFLLLINFLPLFYLIRHGMWGDLIHQSFNLLYGGRNINETNSVFWFVSVLFFTRLLLGFLSVYCSKKTILIITSLLFLIGNSESFLFQYYHHTINFPWNIDVVLVAANYYYVGYFFRYKIAQIKLPVYAVLLLIGTAFILIDQFNIVHFEMDMKWSVYYNLAYIIIIPPVFTLLVIQLARMLEKSAWLSGVFTYLGNNTLPIMYLHLFVNAYVMVLIKKVQHIDFDIRTHVLIFTICGLLFPLLFNLIIQQTKLTRALFTGINYKKQKLVKADFK